ncbi:50S ribosomal protein L4 [Candidatus Woesearchaeota archaeon]|nr:50S ribosomal protein L4 [Candidatus Woesearchaeota archaeon]
MKLKIVDTHKIEKGSKELPIQFYEPVRDDVIRKAVLAIESLERQPYGVSPRAGKRHTVWVSKRRRDYKGSYGHGISRVPRKVMSRSGTQFNWVGAEMPGTVGGRTAHPPKAGKIVAQKINETENRRAIRSAIAATVQPDYIKSRGHKIPKEFPFLVDSKIEGTVKTKDAARILSTLGFSEELERASNRTIRAGKGKNRGRRYIKKVGPLLVVSKNCSLIKAARNIPGVKIVPVNALNAKVLAPGTHPGRLTLWSEAAVDELANQNLFMENYKGETQIRESKFEINKKKKEAPKKEVKKETKAKPTVKKAEKAVKKAQ